MGFKLDSEAGDCYAAVDLCGDTFMISQGREGCIGIMFSGMDDYVYLSKLEAKLISTMIDAAQDDAIARHEAMGV